jgi:hypothetical protein
MKSLFKITHTVHVNSNNLEMTNGKIMSKAFLAKEKFFVLCAFVCNVNRILV